MNEFKTMGLWQITLRVVEVNLPHLKLTTVTQGKLWSILLSDMENLKKPI